MVAIYANIVLAVFLISASALAVWSGPFSSTLRKVIILVLFATTVYVGLNVIEIEQFLNGYIPSLSILVKDLMLVCVTVAFALMWHELGRPRYFWATVMVPVCLALVLVVAWMEAKRECPQDFGFMFDYCGFTVPIYAYGKMAVLGVGAAYAANCLRLMLPAMGFRSLDGIGVFLLGLSLALLIFWYGVAAVSVLHIAASGEYPPMVRFWRSSLSVGAAFFLVAGLFFAPTCRKVMEVYFCWQTRALRKQLQISFERTSMLGGALPTRMMDSLGDLLKLSGIDCPDAGVGGEREMALWLQGKDSAPRSLPLNATMREQARWLIEVSKELTHEIS